MDIIEMPGRKARHFYAMEQGAFELQNEAAGSHKMAGEKRGKRIKVSIAGFPPDEAAPGPYTNPYTNCRIKTCRIRRLMETAPGCGNGGMSGFKDLWRLMHISFFISRQ